jgi:hypothetical protein
VGYAFVLHLDTPEIVVCTRSQHAKMCAAAPNEYRWVRGESGDSICTMDFNQPGVVNYCKDVPALYDYVQADD